MMRIEVGGGGTIANATGWSSTARLSAAGSFSFSMPAGDPAAALAAPMATVSCYVDNVLVGAGIIDDVSVSDGVLTASGDDLTRELALKTIDGGWSDTVQAVMAAIGALVPAGWTFVNSVADNTTAIQVRSRRDSLLNVIASACEVGGCSFAVSGRTLTISDSWGTIVEGVTPTSLRRTTNTYDVFNKVYCYGAGDGSAALTMYGATVTLPAGYALDGAANTITHTASPYGLREKRLDFKEIAPQANTDAGVIAAKNALVIAGYNALKTMTTPIVSYAATVLWEGLLAPMQRLRLAYKSDALTIDATLVITEAAVRAQAGGVVTTDLTLEAAGRRILGDAEVLAGAIKASRLGQAYPQLNMAQDTIVAAMDTDLVTTLTVGHPWFPFRFTGALTQVASIELDLTSVGRPAAELGYVAARVPASINYRVNGAGSWNYYTAPVDITALLVNAQTKRPLQMDNVLNLQCLFNASALYDTQNIAEVTSEPYKPAVGTLMEVTGTGTANFMGFYTAGFVKIKSVPEHTWLRVTNNTWVTPDAVSPYRVYVQATDGITTGLIPMYKIEASGAPLRYYLRDATSMWGDNNQHYSDVGFSATITARVTTKAIVQAN